MKNIILSICISTRNRALFIGETLDSIISQITDEVEIVILDGASTDNTKEVVQRYQQKTSQIRYIFRKKNRGVDQDFCCAVENARGEYCWLFSDDDLLKPNAIQRVLSEIKKGYPLILVNADVYNQEFTELVETKRLELSSDKLYKPSDFCQFFKDTVLYLTFIACVVIRRDIWENREKAKYYGSEFIHVGVIFQAPFPSDILVIAHPYISMRIGNSQWTTRPFKVWMIQWPAILKSFSLFPQQIVDQFHPVGLFRVMNSLISLRAKGAYSIQEFALMKKSWSPLVRAFGKLIAFVPCSLCNFLTLAKILLFKQNQRLDFFYTWNSRYNLFKTGIKC